MLARGWIITIVTASHISILSSRTVYNLSLEQTVKKFITLTRACCKAKEDTLTSVFYFGLQCRIGKKELDLIELKAALSVIQKGLSGLYRYPHSHPCFAWMYCKFEKTSLKLGDE